MTTRRTVLAPLFALVMGLGLVFGVMALFGRPLPAFSAPLGTSVGSDVVTHTTWTAAGSPYLLTADITVMEGVTLTVNPGVWVQGESGRRLEIDGRLVAIGTPTQPITFTSELDSGPGQWAGLRFDTGSSGHLEHVTVRYAGNSNGLITSFTRYANIRAGNGVPLEIRHSRVLTCVYSSSYGSGLNLGSATVLISDTTVAGNSDDGVYASGAHLTVINSHIEHNGGYGLYNSGPVTVTGGTVSHNGDDGISLNGRLLMAGGVISDNLDGIYATGPASLSGLTVVNNVDDGLDVSGVVTVTDTTIRGNHTGIEAKGGSVWGANLTIEDHVFDGIYAEGVPLSVFSSTIRNNGGYPATLSAGDLPTLLNGNNTIVGNGQKALLLSEGIIGADVTLPGDAELNWYRLMDNVGVGAGVTLTVSPGVLVKVDDTQRLEIDGRLVAIGTAAQPITFTSDLDSGGQQWAGLRFDDDSSGQLEHVTVRYAGDSNGMSSTLDRYANIYAGYDSTLEIRHSQILSCTYAEAEGLRLEGATVLISDTRIAHSGDYGVYATDSSHVTVRNSHIEHNGDDGLYNSGPLTVTGSTVSHNQDYGISSGSWTAVRGSTIEDNSNHGIFVSGDLVVTDTAILDNGNYGIYATGDSLTAANLTVEGNGGIGIYARDVPLTLINTAIRNNDSYPAVLPADDLPGLLNGGNTIVGNSVKALQLSAGTIGTDVALPGDAELNWYRFLENITVAPGVTLTVSPGVLIKADEGSRLEIDGRLVALGTAAQPITFTSNSDDGPYQWAGLRFDGDSSGVLAYTTVRYAGDSNGLASSSDRYANIYAGSGSRLDIRHSAIMTCAPSYTGNAGYGLRLSGATALISDTTVADNDDDGVYSTNSALTVHDSQILRNGDFGLYASSPITVTGSTISHNGDDGVFNAGGPLLMSTCVISDNLGDGINATGPATLGGLTIANNADDGLDISAETTIADSTIMGSGDRGIDAKGGSLWGANLTIEDNNTYGIYAMNVPLTVLTTTISNNGGYPAVLPADDLPGLLNGGNTIAGNGIKALQLSAGTIGADVTLPGDEELNWYWLRDNVGIAAGVTLTVSPGVLVKVDDAQRLEIDGRLVAAGTAAQPITFTSYADTGPNEWAGLRFDSNASGLLEHVTVRFAGDSNGNVSSSDRYANIYAGSNVQLELRHSQVISCTYNLASGLRLVGANALISDTRIAGFGDYGIYATGSTRLTVQDSRIEHNVDDGLYTTGPLTVTGAVVADNHSYGIYAADRAVISDSTVEGNWDAGLRTAGPLTVTDTVVKDNDGHGIYATGDWVRAFNLIIEGNDRFGIYARNVPLTVVSTTIKDNGSYPAALPADDLPGLLQRGNTIVGNGIKALEVTEGTIGADVVLPGDDELNWYFLTDQVSIAAGATVTVSPGVSVKVDNAERIEIDGRLVALGTLARPITFTSYADTGPNEWAGLRFDNDSSGSLDHVTVRYGGDSNGSLSASDRYANIYAGSGSTLEIRHSSIMTCEYSSTAFVGDGLRLEGVTALISGTTILDNGGDGLYADGSVLAIHNSRIERNGDGVYAASSEVAVHDSRIESNEDYGLHTSGPLTVTGSTISYNNDDGVSNQGGPLLMAHCVISDNVGDGVWSGGDATLSHLTVLNNIDDGLDTEGALTVSDSTIQGNGRSGIDAAGGPVWATNLVIEANEEDGIYAHSVPVTVLGSTIRNNAGYPAVMPITGLPDLLYGGNTISGNGIKALYFTGGALGDDATLPMNEELNWYRLEDDVTVDQGTTLTVSPGAVVKGNDDSRLEVDGHLVAVGTAAQPITLTSYADTGGGQWAGLRFDGGSTGELAHVTVRFAGDSNSIISAAHRYASIYAGSNSQLDIRHSSILTCSNPPFGKGVALSGATALISDTQIAGNTDDGVYAALSDLTVRNGQIHHNGGTGLYNTGPTTVTGNAIGENGDDGVYLGSSSANSLAQGNQVDHNGGAGIQVYGSSPAIADNTISRNAIGIKVSQLGATPSIWNNIITTNTAGIETGSGANPVIGGIAGQGNFIAGNTNYGIRNSDPCTCINAQYNEWGTADGPLDESEDPDDCVDTGNAGSGDKVSDHVYYLNWVGATTHPPQAPVLVSPADGARISEPRPTLLVTNSIPGSSGPLSYTFRLASDRCFSQDLQQTVHMPEMPDTTYWRPDMDLPGNLHATWQVRSYDGTYPSYPLNGTLSTRTTDPQDFYLRASDTLSPYQDPLESGYSYVECFVNCTRTWRIPLTGDIGSQIVYYSLYFASGWSDRDAGFEIKLSVDDGLFEYEVVPWRYLCTASAGGAIKNCQGQTAGAEIDTGPGDELVLRLRTTDGGGVFLFQRALDAFITLRNIPDIRIEPATLNFQGQGVSARSLTARSPDGQTEQTIELVSRQFVPPADKSSFLEGQAAEGQAPKGRVHALIQFEGVPSPAERAALDERGIKLLTYVPHNAWFASLLAGLSPSDPTLARVHWLGAIQPEDKLAPRVREGRFDAPGLNPDGSVNLTVLFHRDVPLEEASQVVERHGGKLTSRIQSLNGLLVTLPRDAIHALAEEDAVQWIEQVMPPLTPLNDGARARVGVETVQAAPYDLDGSGVKVLVYDGGLVNTVHHDLLGRVILGEDGLIEDHPTHVAGTIGGDGTLSGGVYRGMAPEVDIVSYSTGEFTEVPLYTDPGDLEEDYDQALNIYQVDLSNNSVGVNVAAGGYDCDWEGDYTSVTALVDGIVHGSLGRSLLVVWANGNERGYGGCGVGYRTTPPPATVKNALNVGAINSNDDTMTRFSSWGPTDDGRLKPDVVAPGCEWDTLRDDEDPNRTIYSTLAGGGYGGMCGTSQAAPVATGASALLYQQYAQTYPGSDPLPSTVKAVMIHTAVDLGLPGPDYVYGYGRIDVPDAVEAIRDDHILEDSVEHGLMKTLDLYVSPEDTELKVTLVWDDPAGNPAAIKALVNDLDLVLIDPSGTPHYPWLLNPYIPGDPASTGPDHLNNVEQALVSAPEPGTWQVQVWGTTVPESPQAYSLVHNLPRTMAQTFTVHNDGAGGLRVSSIASQGNSAWLAALPGTPLPMTIPAGGHETVTVTVDLAHLDGGTYHDRLLVFSDDLDESPYPGALNVNLAVIQATEPISGLQAVNSSPTPLGEPTYLAATITQGNNVTYRWAFDDGETGVGAEVAHTYQEVGIYTAVVTASNSINSVTAATTVTVTDAPILGLAATNDGPTALGASTTLIANITAGSNVAYTWDLGDGHTANTATVVHAYGEVGVYIAVVTASNSAGETSTSTTVIVDEPIAGLAAANSGPTALGVPTALTATLTHGSHVTTTWDLGDGESAAGASVNHTYPGVGVFQAVVTASNSVGAMVATTTITVEQAVAGLTAANSSPTALGNATHFTATTTAGTGVTTAWAFGDDETGAGAWATHTYLEAGVYQATATASNSVSSLTATTRVTVEETIANLTAMNDSPTPLGEATALSATVGAGSNVTFAWRLGDGNAGSGARISHPYAALGVYTAVVTASNSINQLTATTWITVTDAPIVGLVASNDSPTVVGNLTTLNATVQGGTHVTYTWDLGDGNVVRAATVSHTYPEIGHYTAVITASNSVDLVTATTEVIISGAVVGFQTADFSVDEDAGTAIINVTLSGAAGVTVSVDYATAEGSAAAGADYTPRSGTLTFDPGVTEQTFSIPILDDAMDEADETVTLTLTGAENADIGTGSATLTIQDDDPTPVVDFDRSDYSVSEDGGSATVTVTLEGASALVVTVEYATSNGSALAGEDYAAAAGTLRFDPGATVQTFQVPIVDNDQHEEEETVILALINPAHATIGENSPATLTILDDDPAGFAIYLPAVMRQGAGRVPAEERPGVGSWSQFRLSPDARPNEGKTRLLVRRGR